MLYFLFLNFNKIYLNKVPFIKTRYCWNSFIEGLYLCILQYPGTSNYVVQNELGTTIILPLSSILAAICCFRFFMLFKFLKNITKWTNINAEYIW